MTIPTERNGGPSMLNIYFASGTDVKCFLPYTWTVPGTPGVPFRKVVVGLSSNRDGHYVGMRLDDWNGASVSNYAEYVLVWNNTNKQVIAKSNDNGSISTLKAFDFIGWIQLHWTTFSAGWGSWAMNGYVSLGVPGVLAIGTVVSGKTWTPTRGGLVMYVPGAASSAQQAYIDLAGDN